MPSSKHKQIDESNFTHSLSTNKQSVINKRMNLDPNKSNQE